MTLGVIFIIIPIVVMGMAGVNMVGKMMKGLFSMALRVGLLLILILPHPEFMIDYY